jgi:aminoglycoside phosphotransferase (APT) family kinase protein
MILATRKPSVPAVYSYCRDLAVLGAELYVMEYVQGRILLYGSLSLPGMTVAGRPSCSQERVGRPCQFTCHGC